MHGTSPDGALGITDGGFRLDLTGSHAGTMFGNSVRSTLCNVGSWLVCGPPPPLNYIWTLFKVEKQKKSSQKKNISSIK